MSYVTDRQTSLGRSGNVMSQSSIKCYFKAFETLFFSPVRGGTPKMYDAPISVPTLERAAKNSHLVYEWPLIFIPIVWQWQCALHSYCFYILDLDESYISLSKINHVSLSTNSSKEESVKKTSDDEDRKKDDKDNLTFTKQSKNDDPQSGENQELKQVCYDLHTNL